MIIALHQHCCLMIRVRRQHVPKAQFEGMILPNGPSQSLDAYIYIFNNIRKQFHLLCLAAFASCPEDCNLRALRIHYLCLEGTAEKSMIYGSQGWCNYIQSYPQTLADILAAARIAVPASPTALFVLNPSTPFPH